MSGLILVVCEANICRSPMAAALLASALPDRVTQSAGTRALVGHRADPLAIELMDERGVDLRAHVASGLAMPRLRAAQLILTMTRVQRQFIENSYPFTRGKVFRLCEHEGMDVVDPYRRGRTTFEQSVIQIEQGVQRWLGTIAGMRH